MIEYYEKLDYKYPEKCIAKEKFNISNPGIVKFYIPTLMPFIEETEPKEILVRASTNHLLNKDIEKIKISESCKQVNYIEIELPNYITSAVESHSQAIDRSKIILAKYNHNENEETGEDNTEDKETGEEVVEDDIINDEEYRGIDQYNIASDKPIINTTGDKVITDINGVKKITKGGSTLTDPRVGELDIENMIPIIPLIVKDGDTYSFHAIFEPKVEEDNSEEIEEDEDAEIEQLRFWGDEDEDIGTEDDLENEEDEDAVEDDTSVNIPDAVAINEPYLIPSIPVLDMLKPNFFYEADDEGMVETDQAFIVVFIGGDIKNRRIIGRYEDAEQILPNSGFDQSGEDNRSNPL